MNIENLKEILKSTNISSFQDIKKALYDEELSRQKKFILTESKTTDFRPWIKARQAEAIA